MKISFEKSYNFFKKYYFYFLILILIILISFNIYIYYTYIYLLTSTDIEAVNDEISINRENLEIILENINERESNLERIENNNYQDPFN